MQEFSDSEPFDYDPSSPVDGGHSVITAGYGAPGAGALRGDERFITWAQETSFTDAFWANDVEEGFVVIWPEHLGSREFLQGIDQAQLAADFQEITGRALPIPPPQPVPVPPPTPAPPPAPVNPQALLEELAAHIRAAAASEEKDITELLAFLASHGL